MRPLLTLLPLLWFALGLVPRVGWAQADASVEVRDASIEAPDGSVGVGGADRDNPELDDTTGRTPTVCRSTQDCERGFSCQSGRCAYVGVREASGCFLGTQAVLLGLGLAWGFRRRTARK